MVSAEDPGRRPWLKKKSSDREIAYRPARVLMQDFTGVPAVVDLAAMRHAMNGLGGDPSKINPLLPVDLVIDHSVQVVLRLRRGPSRRTSSSNTSATGSATALRWGQPPSRISAWCRPAPASATGQPRNLSQAVWTRARTGKLEPRIPRHLRRHRQPQHHGQRRWACSRGRRRHRGGSRDAGEPIASDPRGHRLQLEGQAQGRHHRHRPRVTVHADVRKRGGDEKFVEFRRRSRPLSSRTRHDRQHGAGRRRDLRLLSVDTDTLKYLKATGASAIAWSWSRPIEGSRLARGRHSSPSSPSAGARSLDGGAVAGRAEATAGPRAAHQVKAGFAAGLPDIVKGADSTAA